jgi:hypothetical protein
MSSIDRIQIKLNGRRFEFAKDVALENLLFIKEYLSTSSEQEQKELQKLHDFTYEKSEQKLVGAPGTAPLISHLDVFSFTGGEKGIPTAAPDYFGQLQVALRKNRMPAFEWSELTRKEQEAVSWSVNVFKIEKFLKCGFGTVTAKETSNSNEAQQQQNNNEEESDVIVDKMAHELAKAHMKIAEAKDRQKELQQEEEEKKKNSSNKNKQQESDDDDENVVLTRVGCFMCGVATHDQKDCPFINQKN